MVTLVFLAGLVAVSNETGVLLVSGEQTTCGRAWNLMLMPPKRAFDKTLQTCQHVLPGRCGAEPLGGCPVSALVWVWTLVWSCPGERPGPWSETGTLVPDGS